MDSTFALLCDLVEDAKDATRVNDGQYVEMMDMLMFLHQNLKRVNSRMSSPPAQVVQHANPVAPIEMVTDAEHILDELESRVVTTNVPTIEDADDEIVTSMPLMVELSYDTPYVQYHYGHHPQIVLEHTCRIYNSIMCGHIDDLDDLFEQALECGLKMYQYNLHDYTITYDEQEARNSHDVIMYLNTADGDELCARISFH